MSRIAISISSSTAAAAVIIISPVFIFRSKTASLSVFTTVFAGFRLRFEGLRKHVVPFPSSSRCVVCRVGVVFQTNVVWASSSLHPSTYHQKRTLPQTHLHSRTYLWLVGNGGMGYNYNYYYYHSSIPY